MAAPIEMEIKRFWNGIRKSDVAGFFLRIDWLLLLQWELLWNVGHHACWYWLAADHGLRSPDRRLIGRRWKGRRGIGWQDGRCLLIGYRGRSLVTWGVGVGGGRAGGSGWDGREEFVGVRGGVRFFGGVGHRRRRTLENQIINVNSKNMIFSFL